MQISHFSEILKKFAHAGRFRKEFKMKIVVLAGGISTERDVSLVSGMGIYKALKSKGHQVMLLDVFLGYANEDWKNVFEKDVDWTASVGAIKDQNPDIDAVKALRPDWKKNFFGPHVIDICQQADVVFMALHGENGENGKIQACFDLNGIRYTGTDYVSSAICMNKAISKDLFAAGGVPTPVGIRLKKGETPDVKVPYPCVVKACCGGSSVGVVMANNDEEYAAALEEAFKYDDEVVIEQYIRGREFSGNWKGAAEAFEAVCPTLDMAKRSECALWGVLARSQTGNSKDFSAAKKRLDSLIFATADSLPVVSDLYMTRAQFELYLKRPDLSYKSLKASYAKARPSQLLSCPNASQSSSQICGANDESKITIGSRISRLWHFLSERSLTAIMNALIQVLYEKFTISLSTFPIRLFRSTVV